MILGYIFQSYLLFQWKLKVCHVCEFGGCLTYVYDCNRQLNPISAKKSVFKEN